MKIRNTKIAAIACGATLLASGAAAGAPSSPAGAPLDSVQGSARKDLEASLEELTRLRQTIASEKLPLSNELTRLEDRLASLRRELEESTRDVDTKSLDLGNLKLETKLRQDEVTYLGTLLDEYRSTFESRIDASEIQRYEPVLTAAKNATSNTSLSPDEKLDLQLALVKTSVARLDGVIGGERFQGEAIDPQGKVAQGTFALIGPIALFSSRGGKTAGVSMPQSGSLRPAVRPLEASMTAGIENLVEKGKGMLPLDPTRGGALKALIQKTNLFALFHKGGPIMWPLLLASILALGTVIERSIFLFTEKRRRDDVALQSMLDAVEQGDLVTAVTIGEQTKDFLCRTLHSALIHREKSVSNALMLAQSIELKRFTRGIPILDTVITLAPLLGLLGTVTGMMRSFSLIGGELSAPGAITGGIAEALIATAFGLGIAITALIPFNFLNARVEEVRHQLDAASTRLEILLHPPRDLVIQEPQRRTSTALAS